MQMLMEQHQMLVLVLQLLMTMKMQNHLLFQLV
jgi:hypothetical protein